jgi:hypothetical protein
MILLLAGVFGFYTTTLRVREEGGRLARDNQRMRAALQQIADDVRYSADFVPGDHRGFSGTNESITIVRRIMPDFGAAYRRVDPDVDDLPAAQLDIRRIEYQLVWNEEYEDDEGVPICHGLLRSEQRTFDPNPTFVMESEPGAAGGDGSQSRRSFALPVTSELVSPEIKYLRFEYFDGAEWQDKWFTTTEAEDEEGEEGEEGEGAGEGEGLEGLEGDLLSGGETALAGGGAGAGEEEFVLPQAVKITIGKIRVPREEDEFDITQLKEIEERRDREQYHPDRWTTVVYLPHADNTGLRSRMYGMKEQMGEQTEGF